MRLVVAPFHGDCWYLTSSLLIAAFREHTSKLEMEIKCIPSQLQEVELSNQVEVQGWTLLFGIIRRKTSMSSSPPPPPSI